MNNGKWDFLKNMATKVQIRSKYTFLLSIYYRKMLQIW